MIPPRILAFFAKPLVKFGLPVLVVASLSLALYIQGLRLHSAKVERDAARQTIAQMEAASAANLKAQLAQKAAVEQHYKEQARETDLKYAQELGSARDRLAAYIARNRVRTENSGGVSASSGPAESDRSSGVDGPRLPPELVAVSPDDLEICTVNSERLRAARDWALGL